MLEMHVVINAIQIHHVHKKTQDLNCEKMDKVSLQQYEVLCKSQRKWLSKKKQVSYKCKMLATQKKELLHRFLKDTKYPNKDEADRIYQKCLIPTVYHDKQYRVTVPYNEPMAISLSKSESHLSYMGPVPLRGALYADTPKKISVPIHLL